MSDMSNEKIFENKDMDGIEISNDIFQDYKLNKCNLEAIALRFCTINNNNISDSQIIRSIFDNTTIDKCNFDKSVFEESGFWGGEIKESSFIEVKFIRGDFTSVLIKDCDNTGLELDSMYLDKPVFEKNIFINSKWSDLLMKRTNFCGNNFKNSLFYNGQISNSIFDDNNFEGAEWNNVAFVSCTFNKTDFTKTNFINIRFENCNFKDCIYSDEQRKWFEKI